MKLKIILFFYFISLNIFAKPGDYGRSKKLFDEITDELKSKPNSCSLIWKRIEISRFNATYFDMYKKNGDSLGEFRYFKSLTEIIEGLSILIDKKGLVENHKIAEFKLLRGRAYYFSGKREKAFEDYLSALHDNDSLKNERLFDKIYISLAAYYYNLEDSLTEINARQALKYIKMVTPNSCQSNQTSDCYENEKVELLKFLKEKQQLIDFYKGLIFADYNSYVNTKKNSIETTHYTFDKNMFYFSTLDRINDLAEYYYEIKDYKKSKYLTEYLLKCLPPDTNGQPYKTFPTEILPGIEAENYAKRSFKEKLSWDYQDLSEIIKIIKLKM